MSTFCIYCRVNSTDPGSDFCSPACRLNHNQEVMSRGPHTGRHENPGTEPDSPTGTPLEPTGGLKFDAGKLDWSLLLEIPGTNELVDVLAHGADKYARGNWKLVDGGEQRYLAALLRHAVAICHGEQVDPESGLPHAAHVAVNAIFLSHFQKEEK